MATIQDNYLNVSQFLSKSLSIFKAHIEYTEKFAIDFKEIFQIGQHLQFDYAELVKSNGPGKEGASSQPANTTGTTNNDDNDPTLKEIDTARRLLQKTILEEPITKLQIEWDTPVISNEHRAFSGRNQPLNTVQNEPIQSERPSYILFEKAEPVDGSMDQQIEEDTTEEVTESLTEEVMEDGSMDQHIEEDIEDRSMDQPHSSFFDNDNGDDVAVDNLKNFQSIRTRVNRRKYTCYKCEMKFDHNSALDLHLRSHSKKQINKRLHCDVCHKVFNYSSLLTIHMREHTGDKPFKCTVCEKGFSSAGNLTTHVRVHTGDKPFKCTVCGKRFRQAGSNISPFSKANVNSSKQTV